MHALACFNALTSRKEFSQVSQRTHSYVIPGLNCKSVRRARAKELSSTDV